MTDDLLTAPASEKAPSSPDNDRRVPALVIVWSADEPDRIGEVALFDGDDEELVLGRGAYDQHPRPIFYRQRPGELEERPPLAAPGISREQLLVRVLLEEEDPLHVLRRGKPAMLVNGIATEEAMIRPGDTVEIERRLLLYCVERPARMPSRRHGAIVHRFGEPDLDGILGESPAVWALRDKIAYARREPGHVLVTGESGTGKELAAKAIRAFGKWANGPFVSRNAATLPRGLIEAELFGNLKNYPNAGMPERPGLVGEAQGGVMFLDEIGELPLDLQAGLLRVLDEGEYQRLGDTGRRRSEFRLVGATNRDPEAALKHDLLSRLDLRVPVPSLRDRREDVPFLVRAQILTAAAANAGIAGKFVGSVNGHATVRMVPALMDALVRLPYTTNVREVSRWLKEAKEEATGDTLPIPRELRAIVEKITPAVRPLASRTAPSPTPTEEQLRAALAACGGKVAPAARMLGITRQKGQRLIDRYGIEVSRE